MVLNGDQCCIWGFCGLRSSAELAYPSSRGWGGKGGGGVSEENVVSIRVDLMVQVDVYREGVAGWLVGVDGGDYASNGCEYVVFVVVTGGD